ncbi:hypothetical protein QE152_g900 [Popillia japonica]|uniref:Secreted protein n=1 Tax=Popillia japonica TaxID=7064 RepID=A0AAW1N7N1_POPJA
MPTRLYGAVLTAVIVLDVLSRSPHVIYCLKPSSSLAAIPRDPPRNQINVGLILPHTNFGVREYTRARNSAVSLLHKSRGPRFKWLERYSFATNNIHNVLMLLTPSPTG